MIKRIILFAAAITTALAYAPNVHAAAQTVSLDGVSLKVSSEESVSHNTQSGVIPYTLRFIGIPSSNFDVAVDPGDRISNLDSLSILFNGDEYNTLNNALMEKNTNNLLNLDTFNKSQSLRDGTNTYHIWFKDTSQLFATFRYAGSITIERVFNNGVLEQDNEPIVVEVPTVQEVRITPDTQTMVVGSQLEAQFSILFDNGDTIDLTDNATWTSTNNAVAGVAQAPGVVNAFGVGQATITARVQTQQNTFTANLDITVIEEEVFLFDVTLDPSEDFSMQVGESSQIVATGHFTDNTTKNISSELIWTTSDDEVVKVSDGFVSARSAGTATIMAIHEDEDPDKPIIKQVTITVTDEVEQQDDGFRFLTIEPNQPQIIAVGEDIILSVSAHFSNGDVVPVSEIVTWSSGNNDVATVNQNGRVTGIADGGATIITATFDEDHPDGSIGLSIAVTDPQNIQAESLPTISYGTPGIVLTQGETMAPLSLTSEDLGRFEGFLINQELPQGLTFSEQNGQISGTPTEVVAKTYTIIAFAGKDQVETTLDIVVTGNLAIDPIDENQDNNNNNQQQNNEPEEQQQEDNRTQADLQNEDEDLALQEHVIDNQEEALLEQREELAENQDIIEEAIENGQAQVTLVGGEQVTGEQALAERQQEITKQIEEIDEAREKISILQENIEQQRKDIRASIGKIYITQFVERFLSGVLVIILIIAIAVFVGFMVHKHHSNKPTL